MSKKQYLILSLHYDFLAEILPAIEERAISKGYGLSLPNSPHDFSPDLECCTPAEIKNWESDKTKFDSGKKEEMSGKWGIGIYIYRDEHFIRLAKRVRNFLESWDYGDIMDFHNKEIVESTSKENTNIIEPSFCATCKDYRWCKRATGVTMDKLDFRTFMEHRQKEES